MTTTTTLTTAEANELVIERVGGWEGVTSYEHSRGGTAFKLGRRELGHLHDGAAVAHIPLPRRIRDELIEAGRGRPHPVFPDSGWIGAPLTTATEIDTAVELFELVYDRAAKANAKRGGTS